MTATLDRVPVGAIRLGDSRSDPGDYPPGKWTLRILPDGLMIVVLALKNGDAALEVWRHGLEHGLSGMLATIRYRDEASARAGAHELVRLVREGGAV